MPAQNFQAELSSPWKQLSRLASEAHTTSIAAYFDDDEGRLAQFSIEYRDLYLDFSKNKLSAEALSTLVELAKASPLSARISAQFSGDIINTTEDRAVLHTALRNPETQVQVKGVAIANLISAQLDKMKQISAAIRDGHWKGATGKVITDVVNIGIGGSDLGPKMVCEALRQYSSTHLLTHFVSNVDGAEIHHLLERLNPETTLFIICSKTFSTQETMLNAQFAVRWLKSMLEQVKEDESGETLSCHLIGVTSDKQRALDFGVGEQNLLEIWDWVGGRYSLWSAIGISISISIGFDNFEKLLQGARDMDQHFQSTPFEENMPIILALLGIWYNNFLKAQSAAVIPYCQRMASFPAFLQQLDMESNGKSATLNNLNTTISTGPIIWGQTGTNGQHAFFQLLHQGTKLIPVDFIAAISENDGSQEQHKVLLTNMIAQAAALMAGQSSEDLHKHYAGNKPSNTILMKELNPHALGMLIALYEHKVFVQGVIWNINSFDQWGVELGKRQSNSMLASDSSSTFDASTRELLKRTGKPDFA